MIKSVRLLLTACVLFSGVLFSVQAAAQGKLEHIKVFSPSLQGNLEGENSTRDVFVYLPPGYATSGKRYPVIYFLHGYSVNARAYVDMLHLPDAVNQAIAAGAKPFIIVMPDAFTRFGGSMYSNSPTVGDWEDFVARDLVAYIDAHYRTIPKRASRGLSGHSMGGYGTIRIGMKYPEVFGALYAMSACCLFNPAPGLKAVQAQRVRMAHGIKVAKPKTFPNVLEAEAAAWTPDPRNPPYYFDWPYKDGKPQPLIQARWLANSPLVLVDQYVPALKSYRAIQMDVGDRDRLNVTNKELSGELTRLGVAHGFEIYHGTHISRVAQRFIKNLLPFFAKNLVAE